MRLRTITIVGIALLALAVPAGAEAAHTYSDTISGHEYCLSCTPTATITGGSFSLATALGGLPTLVTGRFTGGTVQVIN